MNKIASIQMASGTNVSANLIEAGRLISDAAKAGANLVVLPENFAIMGLNEEDKVKICEKEGTGLIQEFLSAQAIKNKVWLIGGTIPLCTDDKKRIFASCLVYDEEGNQICRYDKIHLFDVQLNSKNADGTNEIYNESETIKSGNSAKVFDSPFGKIGLAICYDLRFPELFRELVLQGAETIIIPAAFTAITGKAHWEILLRSRAIENLCYVVASAQGGYHVNGRETHGDSMIIDPWGTILDHLPQGTGYAMAEINIEQVKSIRQNFPALKHRKISCKLPTE